MFDKVNLENLKRCVRNNERAIGFDLIDYFSPCGTFGCLVGNDMIAVTGISRRRSESAIEEFELEHYGITEVGHEHALYDFLFMFYRRDDFTKEACLNRLRKTITYIERKRAIWYEADGRVSELARRKEGEFMVCASVMQSLATAV